MNNKQMLCTALAALHTENKLTSPLTDHDVIRKVLASIRLPEYVEEDDERGCLLVLKDIITGIIDGGLEYDKKSILRQIKLECTQNKPFYDSVVDFLDDTVRDDDGNVVEVDETTEEYIASLNRELRGYYFSLRQGLNAISLRKSMGQAFAAINGNASDHRNNDLESVLDNLKADLTSFTQKGHNKIPSLVSELDTSNPSGFVKVFNNIAEKAAGGGLRTGWKSINRMMGIMGGISEEMWLMPALPFNCKSLFSLCMSISIPIFNTPEFALRNVKGDKIPTILDLSLENEMDVNIATAYQMIYGHFEGKAPDMTLSELDDEEVRSKKVNEMSTYFCEKINRNGWHYHFQKHTNDNFRVHYIQDIINDLEAKGYHVVGVRADYLGTINKAGHGNGIAGSDIKEIYRIARNIQVVKNRGFVLGPHQISPEGKRLKALDEAGFIKNLPGRGLYDTCTSLDNEADAEMFFGKRVVEGKSYLEVQRGKHRTIVDTPMKDHYTVIPFSDVGILPWDVDKEEGIETTGKSINHFTGGWGEDSFL